MPEDDHDELTEVDWASAPSRLRGHARGLEKKLKAALADAELGRDAVRQLAVMKLGVDPESARGRLLLKTHEGDEWTPEALKATAEAYEIPLTSDGSTSEPSPLEREVIALRERLGIARQEAMQGQEHFGSQEFGDIRPPHNPKDRLVADLQEARGQVTATDFVGARDQSIAAARDVLHQHGMIMSDEVD